jgi:hypothetical protein
MRNILVAVVVAITLAAGTIYVRRGGSAAPPRSGSTGVVNAPEVPAVDPAPYLAAFPLTPLPAPVIAGASASAKALEKALIPYRKGDYAAAASALDGVRLDHPGDALDATAGLYLGISRLFIGEPQNALEILRTLPPNAAPEIAGEAAWYGLVGIARLRDPSGVEPEAQRLCDSSLTTAARACAALRTLRTAVPAAPRP